MFSYLKAAFWIRPAVPGLGPVPVNALAVLGFAILGFGHAGFWLLGAGLETMWLWAAVQSPLFRLRVEAMAAQPELETAAQARRSLVARLDAENHARLEQIVGKCARAMQLQEESGHSAFLAEANREALQKLGDFALKLLVVRSSLGALGHAAKERELQQQVAALEADLADVELSPAARDSKEATLKIVEQRLANYERREQSLEEIESDLARIEAQIDLAIERVHLRGPDAAVTADLKFVSSFLGETLHDDPLATPPPTRTSPRRVRES